MNPCVYCKDYLLHGWQNFQFLCFYKTYILSALANSDLGYWLWFTNKENLYQVSPTIVNDLSGLYAGSKIISVSTQTTRWVQESNGIRNQFRSF
jgi:hypothetical protein